MTICPVCDDAGFVQAAPLTAAPSHPVKGVMISGSHGQHRKALWSRALTVPCWACAGARVFGGGAA